MCWTPNFLKAWETLACSIEQLNSRAISFVPAAYHNWHQTCPAVSLLKMNFSLPENVQRINGKKRSELLCRKLKRNFHRRRLGHKELTDIRQNNFHIRNSRYLVWNKSKFTSYVGFWNNNYNKGAPKIIKWRRMIIDGNIRTGNSFYLM